MRYTDVILSVLLLVPCSPSAATPAYHVSVGLSDLGGRGFLVQAALYDNSGVIGDSLVLIDNVTHGSTKDDFETSTLGGFNSSLNPASVGLAAGSLDGTGNYVMRLDEDPVVNPAIVYRDYLTPDGPELSFDLEMVAGATAGFWGEDELVVSLLDPTTSDPLVSGLTGLGDVLAVRASGVGYVDTVAVTTVQIPAPAALMLGFIGAGGVAAWRRRSGRWERHGQPGMDGDKERDDLCEWYGLDHRVHTG
jgi:hypothetical protein